jgi:hypothetical protein
MAMSCSHRNPQRLLTPAQIPEEKTLNRTLQCASADCLPVAVHVPE